MVNLPLLRSKYRCCCDANWRRCTATKVDVETHFAQHGTGEITEVKLMNGFGFIEYKDPMDARDVVPGKKCPYPPSSTTRFLETTR